MRFILFLVKTIHYIASIGTQQRVSLFHLSKRVDSPEMSHVFWPYSFKSGILAGQATLKLKGLCPYHGKSILGEPTWLRLRTWALPPTHWSQKPGYVQRKAIMLREGAAPYARIPWAAEHFSRFPIFFRSPHTTWFCCQSPGEWAHLFLVCVGASAREGGFWIPTTCGRELGSSSLLSPVCEQFGLFVHLCLSTWSRQKRASAEDRNCKTRTSANVCSKLPNKVVLCSVP